MVNSSLYQMEKSRTTDTGSTMNVSSPYTRSWNNTPGHVKKLFVRTLSSRNFEQPCSRYSLVQRERERRHLVQQRQFPGPDPTLPHLKYGIFRQKNIRNQARNHSPKEKKCKRSPLPTESTVTSEVKKDWRKPSKRAFYEPPMSYVVRCTGPRYRQLSVSPSTHVDIKPLTTPVRVSNSFSLPVDHRLSMHDRRSYNRYEKRNQNEVPKRRYNSVIFAKKLTEKY